MVAPLRVAWAANAEILQGNAFGYTAASRNLMQAMERRPDVEITHQGDVAVHFCHPLNFYPEVYPGRRQVLFTMYEMWPPPSSFAEGIRRADLVVVPSRFVYDLLLPLVPEAGRPPFQICRLGIDPAIFRYVPGRTWDPRGKEPFRWLWLGAANERKGFKILTVAWALKDPGVRIPNMEDLAFVERNDCRLYLKTTRWQDGVDEQPRWFRESNVFYDERRLSRGELAELYEGAHAFVFPTYGEGFGLTALEALATGLPVVTTGHSGLLDFLDEKHGAAFTGHDEVELTIGQDEGEERKARAMRPQVWGVRNRMLDVMANYPAYLARARRGAMRAARDFTWDRAAEELVAILRKCERRAA